MEALDAETDALELAELNELEADFEADELSDEAEAGSYPAELADLLKLETEDWAALLALLKLDCALTEATEAADEAELDSEE